MLISGLGEGILGWFDSGFFLNFCIIISLFGDISQLTFQKHELDPLEADFSILRDNESKNKKSSAVKSARIEIWREKKSSKSFGK